MQCYQIQFITVAQRQHPNKTHLHIHLKTALTFTLLGGDNHLRLSCKMSTITNHSDNNVHVYEETERSLKTQVTMTSEA